MTHIATIIIECLALIASNLWLAKVDGIFWRFTRYYLGVVCATEIFAFYYVKFYHFSNAWIYNLFLICEVGYITFGLYLALKPVHPKPLMLSTISAAVFIVLYILGISENFYKFQSMAIGVQSVIFVLLCHTYFFWLIKHPTPISIKTNPTFWWVSGVLFYYFGSTMYNIFIFRLFKYLPIENIPSISEILVVIMLILNVLLYCIWSYAFLCIYKLRKSSLSLV